MDTSLSLFKHAGPSAKPFFIAGPCVIESRELCLRVAARLADAAAVNRVDIIFKASYDKANRTSLSSFRGPGKEEGLRILQEVKQESGLPVLTDVHLPADAAGVAEVADVVQIPAYLCRQTDLLLAAAATGRFVNVKKGQFMAPGDMRYAIEKAGPRAWVTERGSCFGYNRLIVDFGGVKILREFGRPVIFDATHSVQTPGGGEGRSSGDREQAILLARAAVAAGVDGLFFEVHPDPSAALCDGDNSIQLSRFEQEAPRLIDLFQLIKGWPGA